MPTDPAPMSNTAAPVVRNLPHEDDPRVVRSLRAVGQAIAVVLDGGDFESVTVQDLLRLAGISRATFYAHYRNKDDALLGSVERMFDAFWGGFEGRAMPGERVAPAAEFIAHIAESPARLAALRAGGRLDEIWRLLVEDCTARLDARLPDPRPGTESPMSRRLGARLLAASLAELVQWAAMHPGEKDPRALDAQFHEMVWRVWGRA
ncbi:MAG: TetR/AcrR family transcriptional regulator [Gemmatimonadaceae bacterium]|jgi:AcrR family transcriptional regulator|nr:TetR/AcrR family transcriptional regulator [Gemmatimonadaceae bacterium]